ncbi:creatininase family protein [Agromyces bauzanensis]
MTEIKKLDEMRLPTVKEEIDGEGRIFIPLGSTEQHGPHAPYGTDTILATEACRRIISRLGGVLAPAVPYGLSGDHLGFPGVPYLSVNTFIGVLRDLALSLAAGGFKKIVFVNGHYTNVMAISAALAEVGGQLPEGAVAYGFTYWDAMSDEQMRPFLSVESGLHANIGETSGVLAVRPELVDMSAAVAEFPELPGEPNPALVSAYFFSRLGATHNVLDSGVWGDPSGSSAELGEMFLEQVGESAANFVLTVEKMFVQYPDRHAH